MEARHLRRRDLQLSPHPSHHPRESHLFATPRLPQRQVLPGSSRVDWKTGLIYPNPDCLTNLGPSNYQFLIPELTKKGYGVVLPELLGYGATDKPRNIEAYAFKPMAASLAAILDAAGVDKAIVVGHDFGMRTSPNDSFLIR